MSGLDYIVNVEEDAKGFTESSFEVLPPGWYKVVIVGSEIVDTKKGAEQRDKNLAAIERGEMPLGSEGKGVDRILNYTYEVQDGTGRTLTDRMLVNHTSDFAQEIGRKRNAKIALSCGHKGTLLRTEPLHGRPFEVKVIIEDFASTKHPGETSQSNKCTNYRPVQPPTGLTPVSSETTKPKAPMGW